MVQYILGGHQNLPLEEKLPHIVSLIKITERISNCQYVSQLAPDSQGDNPIGTSDIRWQQSYEFGYVPNDQLQRFFMAVAMDLPDYDSPYGS